MVIGITGGAGVLGRALTLALQAQGMGVVVLDCQGTGPHRGNIHHTQDLQHCFAACHGIIHLAGVSSVAGGAQDPQACHQENVEGTRNVLEFCRTSLPQKWMIFASSREVYGAQPAYPVQESASCHPISAYGKSKWAAEHLVHKIGNDFQVPYAIVRLSNVYGSLDDIPSRVVMRFVHQALAHQEITCLGAQTSCDFLHIQDVCRAVLEIITRLQSGAWLPVMNLCSAIETPLVDLARVIVQVAQSRSPIKVALPSPDHTPRFVGSHETASISLGWRPQIGLRAGLTTLIKEIKMREHNS